MVLAGATASVLLVLVLTLCGPAYGQKINSGKFHRSVMKLRSRIPTPGEGQLDISPMNLLKLSKKYLKGGTDAELKSLLRDENPYVRLAVLFYMTELDAEKYLETLKAYTDDKAEVTFVDGDVSGVATVGWYVRWLIEHRKSKGARVVEHFQGGAKLLIWKDETAIMRVLKFLSVNSANCCATSRWIFRPLMWRS